MDFFQYIPLSKAQEIVNGHLQDSVIGSEKVHLAESLDRITAEDVVAMEDVPPFHRSTVDGFAVCSDDTFGASETSPALFTIVDEIVMGQPAAVTLTSGQAAAIPTGGMLPPGADAVVMFEHTETLDANTLLVKDKIAPGENIVSRGEDVGAGAVIVAKGQKITPQHIGILAACGCTQLAVRERLKVAVISTGDELVDIGQPVPLGKIRDVNYYVLSAMLREAGCQVKQMGIVEDCYEKFLEALMEAVKTCHMVVISGGSSVGARDYTVKAIDALGKPGVLVHGISVKPGRPTIFAMVKATPIFGLPGHPVAAMTICEQMVKPAVRCLMGQGGMDGLSIPATMLRNVASAPGRDDFVNVRLSKRAEHYVAEPILGKSGLISIAAQADGMVRIPSNESGLYEGDVVEVFSIKKTR